MSTKDTYGRMKGDKGEASGKGRAHEIKIEFKSASLTWRLGAWSIQGASTNGSQPLDWK